MSLITLPPFRPILAESSRQLDFTRPAHELPADNVPLDYIRRSGLAAPLCDLATAVGRGSLRFGTVHNSHNCLALSS